MVVAMEESGSLIIDVDGSRLTSRFINDEGEIMDVFSIEKRPGFVSNATPCALKPGNSRPPIETSVE